MRFLSLCSGIEAASVAWAPLGWKAAAVAEIEAFPSAVLAHHYPDVPNLGDITKFKEWPDLGAIDLICGGTPCQSFSVAGLRKGLADPRGNLSLTFLAIVDRYRPRWVVWENVPGVLSSDGGRDFASFLGGLGQLGYGWCFRVLDAQYCRVDGFPRAVPQRRRRVFVVGYLGDWRRAAAVLSEPESVLGDTPPRREAGQGTAQDVISSLTASGRGVERAGETRGQDPVVAVVQGFAFDGQNIASSGLDSASPTLDTGAAHSNRGLHIAHVDEAACCVTAGYAQRLDWETENFVAHSLRAEGFDASEDGTGRGTPLVPVYSVTQDSTPVSGEKFSPSLKVGTGLEMGQPPCIAFDTTQVTSKANRSNPKQGDPCHPLAAGAHPPAIASAWAVRRLTPTECERLQGFPDGYTAIPYRGKPAADGPRYKALGNSWAVNVARWVGRRIEMVEKIAADLEKERAA